MGHLRDGNAQADQNMNLRHLTMIGLVIAFYVIAIYDTYCEVHGDENTITAVIRDSSKLNAILPVVGGVLAGHLFGEFLIEFVIGIAVGVMFWNPLGQTLRGRWSQ